MHVYAILMNAIQIHEYKTSNGQIQHGQQSRWMHVQACQASELKK